MSLSEIETNYPKCAFDFRTWAKENELDPDVQTPDMANGGFEWKSPSFVEHTVSLDKSAIFKIAGKRKVLVYMSGDDQNGPVYLVWDGQYGWTSFD